MNHIAYTYVILDRSHSTRDDERPELSGTLKVASTAVSLCHPCWRCCPHGAVQRRGVLRPIYHIPVARSVKGTHTELLTAMYVRITHAIHSVGILSAMSQIFFYTIRQPISAQPAEIVMVFTNGVAAAQSQDSGAPVCANPLHSAPLCEVKGLLSMIVDVRPYKSVTLRNEGAMRRNALPPGSLSIKHPALPLATS